MIKLIVSDVDGTLLPEGTPDMNPEIYEVIRKLKERGIVFAAASGRQFPSVRSVFMPVERDIYFISNNGAYVTYQDQVLDCRTFPRDVAGEIVAWLRAQPEMFYLLTHEKGDVTDYRDPDILHWLRDGYHIKIEEKEDVLQLPLRYLKISGYCEKTDAAVAARPAVKQFAGRAQVTAAGDYWIDFTPPGSEKGHAVEKLQKLLQISREETMAFGDNNNDISLLRSAGESYAVAHARAELKAAAKYTLEDESGDAVLHVLKGLLG